MVDAWASMIWMTFFSNGRFDFSSDQICLNRRTVKLYLLFDAQKPRPANAVRPCRQPGSVNLTWQPHARMQEVGHCWNGARFNQPFPSRREPVNMWTNSAVASCIASSFRKPQHPLLANRPGAGANATA